MHSWDKYWHMLSPAPHQPLPLSPSQCQMGWWEGCGHDRLLLEHWPPPHSAGTQPHLGVDICTEVMHDSDHGPPFTEKNTQFYFIFTAVLLRCSKQRTSDLCTDSSLPCCSLMASPRETLSFPHILLNGEITLSTAAFWINNTHI